MSRFLSCLNTNFLSRLWTPSPQLTPPNPHSSPCRLPEEICLYPVNAVQRVHWVPLSLFLLSFSVKGVIFCRLLHAFQPPTLHFFRSSARKCKQCWQSSSSTVTDILFFLKIWRACERFYTQKVIILLIISFIWNSNLRPVWLCLVLIHIFWRFLPLCL